MDDYIALMTAKFEAAKIEAHNFAERYNSKLPTGSCPTCQECGIVPGLPCPECSHVSLPPYGIVIDSEYGYQVVSIANRREIIFDARVDD